MNLNIYLGNDTWVNSLIIQGHSSHNNNGNNKYDHNNHDYHDRPPYLNKEINLKYRESMMLELLWEVPLGAVLPMLAKYSSMRPSLAQKF